MKKTPHLKMPIAWISQEPNIRGRGPWFTEAFGPNEYHSHRLKKVLAWATTPFQKAALVESRSFGRCLILDGETQSSAFDEAFYHECLVHPAMLLHPKPRRVLILGGGEGATAREALRYGSLRQLTMVDIDSQVIEFAKKFLLPWHQGAFLESRLRLVIDDGRRVIENEKAVYDVIYSDLPSPLPDGPAYKLYTVEFYRMLKKRLAQNGIFALQSSSGHPLQIAAHLSIVATLRRVFPVLRSFYVFIPSYDLPWSFTLGALSPKQDPLLWPAARWDRLIRARIKGNLRFLDGVSIEGLLRPPLYYRSLWKKTVPVITDKRPRFFLEENFAHSNGRPSPARLSS